MQGREEGWKGEWRERIGPILTNDASGPLTAEPMGREATYVLACQPSTSAARKVTLLIFPKKSTEMVENLTKP